MLNVNPPFIQGHQQPQGPPPPQATLAGHPNLSFMANHPGSAPGPSMLGGPQGGPGMGPNGPFPLHMRQASAQRPPSFVQQPHNGQPFNAPMPGGPSHMNGIGAAPLQSPFPTQNMQPIRRPPQQGQQLNPPMAGMPGQPVVGTVTGLPGVTSMNGQNMNGLGIGGNPSLRQGPPNGMRMQPSMIQSQGHLPEMNMNSLHHPPQMRGPNGMIPNVSRGPSHFMGNPQSAQSHPAGMQTPLQFQSMNHTQNPMGASPHVSPPHSAGPMSAPQLNHSNSMPSLQATRHRMTPDNNAVMAAGHHAPSHRLPTINSQFSYMQPHSSPPPNPMGDPSQIAGPSSQPAGAGGNLVNTPAQTLQQQMNPEGYSFAGPSHPQQANALRPHSRLATHPGAMPNQEMQSNQAPHTPAMQQLPRPPSVANRQSPFPERRSGSVQGHRPPSRPSSLHNAQSPQHAAQPRTPRMSQPPSGVQSQPPNASAPSVPRQPSAPPSVSAEEQNSSVAPPSFRPSQVPPPRLEPQQIAQAPMSLPRNVPIISLQGLTRMLSFSGSLAADSPQRLQMSYWDSIVNDYFLPRATFKFTLWKDNQRMEAKPFEIGVPILPRFFLVTSQSGVKAMHLTLDNARERPIGAGRTSIECLDAIWTFRYMNGYVVTLRGNLTATMLPVPIAGGQSIPKFEALTFDANHHDKTISLDAIIGNRQVDVTTHPPTPRQAAQTTTANGTDGSQTQIQPPLEDPLKDEPKVMVDRAIMPAEPVNAFGIPQATMRCLELAESVAQMSDLIYYSKENDLGPLDALKQFALVLRETRSTAMMPLLGDMGSSDIKPAIPLDHNSATNGSSPAYMGTPGQSHPQPPQGSMNGLQMGPPNPDVKPSKSSLAQAQASVPISSPSSGPASATTPAAGSTPGASSSTPLVANATLKRKAQADTASPTTSHDSAPPAKRTNRKRGKTQGG